MTVASIGRTSRQRRSASVRIGRGTRIETVQCGTHSPGSYRGRLSMPAPVRCCHTVAWWRHQVRGRCQPQEHDPAHEHAGELEVEPQRRGDPHRLQGLLDGIRVGQGRGHRSATRAAGVCRRAACAASARRAPRESPTAPGIRRVERSSRSSPGRRPSAGRLARRAPVRGCGRRDRPGADLGRRRCGTACPARR